MVGGSIESITFRVTVNGGTPAGTVISNQGIVDTDQNVPEPTDVDGIDSNGDQPTDIIVGDLPVPDNPLYAEKLVEFVDDVDGSGDISAGDVMRYIISLHNLGDQALTNVTFIDTIPTGLTFIPATESITGPGATIVVIGQAVNAAVPSISVGGFEIAQFEITIDSPLVNFDVNPLTEEFVNQGIADSDQTPSVLSDSNGDPTDGNQPTDFLAVAVPGTGAPNLDVEKRATLAVDLDGDGLFDPGDVIEYVILIQNSGPAVAENVFFDDPVPTDTMMVFGSLTTSQGIIVTEDPVAVNLGNLAPASSATISFQVTIDGATACGTVIDNQGTLSGDNFASADSDDNADDNDGINPTLVAVDSGCGSGEPSLNKTLTSTSELDSVGNDVFVGEVLNYEATFTIPAGTTRQVTLSDALPVGLGYVAGSAELAATFDIGLIAFANPASINTTASNTFVSLTEGIDLVVAGQDLSLLLGDVINSDIDGIASYTLRFEAVVENIPSTQIGVTYSNEANLTFWDGLSQLQSITDTSAAVTVLEANLPVTKTANPTVLSEAAGGTVTYTVTVTNPIVSNVGPAYDVRIFDQGPSAYSSITVTGIATTGGITGITDLSNPFRVDLRIDVLPPGAELTITYDAVALPPLNLDIINAVRTTWTSLPGTQGTGDATPGSPGAPQGERTGGSGTVNDYKLSDNAVVQILDSTPTATHTDGPTATVTATRTRPPQNTTIPTLTPLPTLTPIRTNTPIGTSTPTRTRTRTSIPTNSPIPTLTPIPTNTAVGDSTPTTDSSPTPTPTRTRTETLTPVGPTFTPSLTGTPTATRTPSKTRTPSATRTPTATFTPGPLGDMGVRFVAIGRVHRGKEMIYSMALVTYSRGTVPDVVATLRIPEEVEYLGAYPSPTSAPAIGGHGVIRWELGNLVGPVNRPMEAYVKVREEETFNTQFTSVLRVENGFQQFGEFSRLSRVGKSERAKDSRHQNDNFKLKVAGPKRLRAGSQARYRLLVRSSDRSGLSQLLVRAQVPAEMRVIDISPEPSFIDTPSDAAGLIEWVLTGASRNQKLELRVITDPALLPGTVLESFFEADDYASMPLVVMSTTTTR